MSDEPRGYTESEWREMIQRDEAILNKLRQIKEHPEQHRHDWVDLQACCMVDGVFDPLLMDAHPELGRNGGQKCDVLSGPCACGGWH